MHDLTTPEATQPARRPRLLWLALAVAAVPPLLVASTLRRFALDVPIKDQWAFAAEVVAFVKGEYVLGRLFLPVGQHRVVLPKLVMLPLAALTRWDVCAEIWFNFATVVASLVLVADLARLTLRRSWPAAWAWTVPVASAALFSLASWQSWTWGWMMAAYLNVLATVVVAWALGRFGLRGAGPAVMAVGAVAAGLSFISGLTLLVLVPLALLVLPSDAQSEHRGRRIAIVAAVLVVAGAFYVATYPPGMRARTMPRLSFQPLELALFTVRYLGSPLAAQDLHSATWWGAAGLLAVATSTAFAWRRAPESRAALLPWLLLATYVIASGAVTAVGRLGRGPELAITSRYTTISSLFWVSLPPCVLLAAHAVRTSGATRAVRTIALAAAASAILVAGRSYVTTWERAQWPLLTRSLAIARGGACLRARTPADACLGLLSRNPKLVRQRAGQMRRLRIGLFRDDLPSPAP